MKILVKYENNRIFEEEFEKYGLSPVYELQYNVYVNEVLTFKNVNKHHIAALVNLIPTAVVPYEVEVKNT